MNSTYQIVDKHLIIFPAYGTQMTSTNSPHLTTTSQPTRPAVHSAIAQSLMEKIEAKTAIIAIVGLGYVGLPLVQAIRDSGFPVIGFDVDQKKIDGTKSCLKLIHLAYSKGLDQLVGECL